MIFHDFMVSSIYFLMLFQTLTIPFFLIIPPIFILTIDGKNPIPLTISLTFILIYFLLYFLACVLIISRTKLLLIKLLYSLPKIQIKFLIYNIIYNFNNYFDIYSSIFLHILLYTLRYYIYKIISIKDFYLLYKIKSSPLRNLV